METKTNDIRIHEIVAEMSAITSIYCVKGVNEKFLIEEAL